MPRGKKTIACGVPPARGPFPGAAERAYELNLAAWQPNRRPANVTVYSVCACRVPSHRACLRDLHRRGGAFRAFQRMLRRNPHLKPITEASRLCSRSSDFRRDILHPMRTAVCIVVAYDRRSNEPLGVVPGDERVHRESP